MAKNIREFLMQLNFNEHLIGTGYLEMYLEIWPSEMVNETRMGLQETANKLGKSLEYVTEEIFYAINDAYSRSAASDVWYDLLTLTKKKEGEEMNRHILKAIHYYYNW